MKHITWLLIERADGWQACKCGQEGPKWSNPSLSAQAVKAALDRLGYRAEPLVVGLHVNRCVTGEFEADKDTQARQRDELLYDFEQAVPFSAEDLTAEFTVGRDSVFGVGVPVADLKPFLEELQDLGVNVESVSPNTLLAVQSLGEFETNQFVVLVSDCLELVHITSEGVCQWHRLPASDTQALQKLKLAGASPADSVLVVGESKRANSLLQAAGLSSESSQDAGSYDELIILAASKIAAGEWTNKFELNQPRLLSTDKLRRLRPAIHFALVGLAVGLLLIMGSLVWQIQSYSGLSKSYRKGQEEAYSKIHTGAIPQSIKLRLASEWKKTKQQAALAKLSSGPQSEAVVATLHRLLVSLDKVSKSASAATPFHFRVTAMNFGESGQASLYIDFKNRSDADRVRQQLISEGFEVKAFPTRMRDGRVVVDAIIRLKPAQAKPS